MLSPKSKTKSVILTWLYPPLSDFHPVKNKAFEPFFLTG